MNQAKRKCVFKIRTTTNVEGGVLSWKGNNNNNNDNDNDKDNDNDNNDNFI